jgi:polyferredoxin
MAFLRRIFCKEFCPYGRFQTVLVDTGTLVLRFHPDEAPRCIRCGACVNSCPTGIDIREGEQIECINCGRCLDACRNVMAQRGQAGIIRYTFGLEGRGFRALLNLRMALVTLSFVAISGGLVAATVQRSPLTLKAARNASLLPRTVSGDRVANFFTVYLVNRSSTSHTVTFEIDAGALAVQWRGLTGALTLAGGEHRRIDFGLETDARGLHTPQQVELSLHDESGSTLAATTLTLTGPLDKPAGNR